jgi:hypothetical protein
MHRGIFLLPKYGEHAPQNPHYQLYRPKVENPDC